MQTIFDYLNEGEETHELCQKMDNFQITYKVMQQSMKMLQE